MLTTKEEVIKKFMVNRFLNSLHDIFKRADAEKYEKWQGNCCRQAAVFGKVFLDELLPEYEWEAWDGIFNDVLDGKKVHYNHAWIYGKQKDGEKKLLVDLSRNRHERLFIEVKKNQYPRNIPSYKHMRCLQREKMDIAELWTQKEFYTSLTSDALLQKIKRVTKFDNFKEGLTLKEGEGSL